MIELKWKDVRNGPMYTEPVPIIYPVEERNAAYTVYFLKIHNRAILIYEIGIGMHHRESTA